MTDKGYFSATRDREVIDGGGFFCLGCLICKLPDDISLDPRYCINCYEVLVQEAELAPAGAKMTWRPAPKRGEALPVVKGVVAKLLNKGIPPMGVLQRPGGRPIKEGEVHWTTAWRRKKVAEAQRVMV